jgi:hypothetical protein
MAEDMTDDELLDELIGRRIGRRGWPAFSGEENHRDHRGEGDRARHLDGLGPRDAPRSSPTTSPPPPPPPIDITPPNTTGGCDEFAPRNEPQMPGGIRL